MKIRNIARTSGIASTGVLTVVLAVILAGIIFIVPVIQDKLNDLEKSASVPMASMMVKKTSPQPVKPLMHGKVNLAKWSEASVTAGVIRKAVIQHYLQYGYAATSKRLDGKRLDSVLSILGFGKADLDASRFIASNYTIVKVGVDGKAAIAVSSAQDMKPAHATLTEAGVWRVGQ